MYHGGFSGRTSFIRAACGDPSVHEPFGRKLRVERFRADELSRTQTVKSFWGNYLAEVG